MRTVGVGANTGSGKSIEELAADNNMLREANDGARKRICELEQMLTESRKEAAELTEQLDDSRKETAELEQMFAESRKEAAELKAQLAESKKEKSSKEKGTEK